MLSVTIHVARSSVRIVSMVSNPDCVVAKTAANRFREHGTPVKVRDGPAAVSRELDEQSFGQGISFLREVPLFA